MHLVAGFTYSQVLQALVELEILEAVRARAEWPERLADATDTLPERMEALCQAGAALGLLTRTRRGRFRASRTGAALLGVPGLLQMIRHNRVLYRDMEDLPALLRGEGETELARFWPYVFGAGAASDPETAKTYSDLMADTQSMVAAETLAAVRFKGAEHILDVGGGTGVFLSSVARAATDARLTLFDLPAVVEGARDRIASEGQTDRIRIVAGSFRDDPLPEGADRITLIRVLYDHADETVEALLAKVFTALQPGGRIVISEPMSGGRRPDKATDTYFAFYTMAMGTGRCRSQDRIGAMLKAAGFTDVRKPHARRAYVTSVVTAKKPV